MKIREALKEVATSELEIRRNKAVDAVSKACEGTTLNTYDLMRYALGGRTNTIKAKLVKQLTDEKEQELIAQYNDQQELV